MPTVLLSCSKCGKTKPLDDFRRRPDRSIRGKRRGRWSSCKECERAYQLSEVGRSLQNARMIKFRKNMRESNYDELRRRERESNLRRKYGFGEVVYQELVEEQEGRCAICEEVPTKGRGKKLHIDHDHVTGKIRGLLCGPCNTALGGFRDDVEIVRKAADYLESFS